MRIGSENIINTNKKVTVVILATLSSSKKAERKDFDNTKYIQTKIVIVVICKKMAGIMSKESVNKTIPKKPKSPCV